MALLASFHEEVEGTENRVRSTLAEEEAMAAEIEAARWLVTYGAWRVDQGTLEAAKG